MKVQDVFTNKDKLLNSFFLQQFQYFALQCHDVVVKRVVPFSHQFNDGKTFCIIAKQDF